MAQQKNGWQKNGWSDIKHHIHNQILNKTWVPGDKLPKDSEIALHYHCARTTVQRAMRALAELGVVERTRKGGTFVKPFQSTHATVDIPIIQQQIESAGDTYTYKLILRQTAPLPSCIGEKWHMDISPSMLHVQSLHLANDSPYIYEDRWINTLQTPDILRVDLQVTSANAWLVKNCPYSHFTMCMYATNTDANTAKILNTAPNQAILVIDRTSWIHNTPITSVRLFTKPAYKIISR